MAISIERAASLPAVPLRGTGSATALETLGYLGEGSSALYYVHHSALGNVHGTVLMCGALGLESAHAALVWTHFARMLAAAGWNAVRFDWRGTGESGGDFAETGFESWKHDVRRLHDWVTRDSEPPVVLMGLRGGALVAAACAAAGLGDALVLWEPPASGRAHMMDVLRRKLAADYALGGGSERRTREKYVADLEAGRIVEVEGFPWTRGLWQSMTGVELSPLPGRRPTLVVSSRTHRLPRPPFWQDSLVLCPDLSEWFSATLSFLRGLGRSSSLAVPRGERVLQAEVGRSRREIVSFFQDDLRLVATHHLPVNPSATAVLFGNFGYVPRSGGGGLAARICDELAAAGVHGFRVDLPGLGDSEGGLSLDSHEWFERVRAGSMVGVTLGIVERLRSRFGVEKVLLGGLCAAATTALYALERDPRAIAGLLLLEPELFTTDTIGEEPPDRGEAAAGPSGWLGPGLVTVAGYGRKAFTRWSWMRIVTGESDAARHFPIPRGLVRRLLWFARDQLPARTNLPLVASWQNAVRRRVPVLIVTAEGKMRELFFERVNEVAVPGYGQLVGLGRAIEHVRIPETNHTFTTGGAIERVADAVTQWVLRRFVRGVARRAAESVVSAGPLTGPDPLGRGTANAV